MKTLNVNRKTVVSILTTMLLIYWVQGISYGQGDTPTVTPGDTNTFLRVSFTDFLYEYDENAYQIQLRRKSPQGDWITKCSTISLLTGPDNIYSADAGNYKVSAIFTDLEPGVTYEARYRDTNLSECQDNPPSPQSWSVIAEGTTHLVTPPRVEFADAALATAVRKALDLETQGEHIELLKIPEAELAKLKQLQHDRGSRASAQTKVSNLTGLEHATQLATLSLGGFYGHNISDLTPLAQLTQLTTLDLSNNNISDLTPLAQLTQLTTLDLSNNNISDLTPLAQLTQLTKLDLGGFNGNNISDLTPLTQLMLLRKLDLENNNISDLTPVAQLTQLRDLHLSFNLITDVTPLAQLTNLAILFLLGNNISDLTPLAQLPGRTTIYAVLFEDSLQPSGIELITVSSSQFSSSQPLTETTLNGVSVTLTLVPSGAAYDTSIDNIRNALTLTGIDDVTVSDVIRVSDTELNVTFGYTGNLDNIATLTISLGAEAVTGYEGRALTAAIPVYPERELGLTVTFRYPLSAVTLNNNVVTLTLSGGTFVSSRLDVSRAITISGISRLFATDEDRVSATVATIELAFSGKFDMDKILTVTVKASGIKDYFGSALTAEIPVSASTEVEVTGELVASTAFPLTKATLNGSFVKFTLKNHSYWKPSLLDYVVTSGIPDVATTSSLKKLNSKEMYVTLSFKGSLNSDATLTFLVPPSVIKDYYGPPLAATLPVTVKTGRQVLVPESQRPSVLWINTETDKIESLEPFDAVTQQVTSLNVDTVGGKVYWSEHGSDGGTIKRANFDGTSTESLVTLPTTPQSITVDTVRKKLYWGDTFEGKIQTVDLNGGNIQTIIRVDDDIRHIAVDAEGAKLYWVDSRLRFLRVNLDGTSIETILTRYYLFRNRTGRVGGIAIADGKIYWTEGQNSSISSIAGGIIYRANLNGANLETLATPLGRPTGVAVDTVNGKVYWALLHGGIQRTDINGGEIENVVYGITAPGGIALGAVSTQPTTPTPPEIPISAATLKFLPSPAPSPAIGEQLTLSLNIADGENVAGYQATVQFDGTALRYVSSAIGDYLPAGAFPLPAEASGNTVTLAAVSLTGESAGDGTLSTITFEVIAVKESTLTLSGVLLSDSAETASRPQVEAGLIVEPPQLKEDVNGDGVVNILDLVRVASSFGGSGENGADVNGDGVVNILDLVLVAGAFGNAAAPSADPQALAMLTATDVGRWLAQAGEFGLVDTTAQRGVLFLEQLLAALTPKETALLPNYPNPFNPETWIPYGLANDTHVQISIYDISGALVRQLDLGHRRAGHYTERSRAAYWDGRNGGGEHVASGVYFYTLTADDFTATRKMLIGK